MKIAFLHYTLGFIERGSEISTGLIASELAKTHQVLVMQTGKVHKKSYSVYQVDSPKVLKVAPQNLLDKIIFRLYLDPLSRAITQFTIQSISKLKKFDPDLIIPVNGKPQIKIIKKNFPHSKIVVFGRAGIGYHDQDNLLQNPDLFVALSPQAKAWADHLASKNTKVIYLPNPIDLNHFKTTKPAKIDLKPPIILVVAALSVYKNVDQVIRAVAATSASLLIIGDGESRNSLVNLADRLLPNRHQFIHQVSYQELPSYYRAAHVFCFVPDPQEAFGRVYLEAMAVGLPIVASADPIRKSIIGPQGFYAEPSFVDSISNQVNLALSAGKTNYQLELSRYSLPTIVSHLNQQFQKLVS